MPQSPGRSAAPHRIPSAEARPRYGVPLAGVTRPAGTRRTPVRWSPTYGEQRAHPSSLTGAASSHGQRRELGTCDEDIKNCEHPLTSEVISIGIGRSLTASPPTNGRSGHVSGGSVEYVRVIHHPNLRIAVRQASGEFTPAARHDAQHLAECHLIAPRRATTPLHRSGLRLVHVCGSAYL